METLFKSNLLFIFLFPALHVTVSGIEIVVESSWFELDLRPPITETATPEYIDWLARHFDEAKMLNLKLVSEDSDPDQDGFSNLFEFLAKLDPLDKSEKLQTQFEAGDKHMLCFYPIKPGVNFSVLYSLDLKSWQPLEAGHFELAGEELRVDLNAFPSRAYYRLRLSEPDS